MKKHVLTLGIALFLLSNLAPVNRALSQGVPNFSIISRPLADVIDSVSGSVAFIRTEEYTGSGFYATTDGFVVTARHVIKLHTGSTATHIEITQTIPAAQVGSGSMQGVEISSQATVIAEDPEHDLALLKLSQDPYKSGKVVYNGKDVLPRQHPAVLCTRTVSLRSGDPIFTVGHPFGDLRKITTAGIIASPEPIETDAAGNLRGTYVVNMVINHGNSGGPVFSSTGCVIGVADQIRPTPVQGDLPGGDPLDSIQLTLNGPDGKPLMANGKQVLTTLEYSSGLGLLIPQQYILKMLDVAGFSKAAAH